MELKLFSLSFLAVLLAPSVILGVEIDCQKPPENVEPDFCCSTPIFFGDHLVLECEKSLGWNESMSYSEYPDDQCLSECLMKKAQIIVDGHIKRDVLQEKFLSHIRSPWWRGLFPEFIDYCLSSVGKDEVSAAYDTKSSCKVDALLVIDCIYLKLFGNCPEEIWRDTKNCQTFRDFIVQCTKMN